MKGLFVTFEGGEGSGKSTILDLVYEELLKRGISVIKTREPGGVKISEEIRNVILDVNNTLMKGRTEALLYAASRHQHLSEVVIPALNDGKVVLCDRYLDSSLAYQGYAREIGVEEVLSINLFAIDGMFPDVTLFFDCPPSVGLERIAKNKGREVNRLDKEKLDFHNKVYEGYKIVEEMYKERFTNIDATKSIEEVYKDSLDVILAKLK